MVVADRIDDLTFSAPRSATTLIGDAAPFATSVDGLTLWFGSNREAGVDHVYRATRTSFAEDFANPVRDDSVLANAFSFSIDPTTQLAFVSDRQDMYLATYPIPTGPLGPLQDIIELNTVDVEYDLSVTPDGRAFWTSGPNDPAVAPSIYTADFDPATRTFSNRRRWEFSQDGVGEHGVSSTLDGTELWLALHDEPAVGGTDLFVSRRACLN